MKLKSKQHILSKRVFLAGMSVCCQYHIRNWELWLSFEIFYEIEIIW